MNNGDYVESFNLQGVTIKTTVTNNFVTNVVDSHISRFISCTSDNYKTKVFGFDIEWYGVSHDLSSKCAIVLYDGESCLIFQLKRTGSVPKSLIDFLHHPNYTFVGFGIKDNVCNLKKFHGFGCRNVVDISSLAYEIMGRKRIRYCGVDELAIAVSQLDLRIHRPLCTSFADWGGTSLLSKEQAKHATINVYSYHRIGTTLLAKL